MKKKKRYGGVEPFYCPPNFARASIKPGSHERRKHKDKIKTKTKRDISSGTCKDKTTRIFLCFAFCSSLGLCLDYDLILMITTILISQT